MIIVLIIWYVNAVNSETPTRFTFTQQPESQSVKHNTSVTLLCQARYDPYPVRYRWYRMSQVQMPPNEDNLLNSANSTITIDIYRTDSKLLFQCCAESQGQKIYSDVGKVTITYFEFKGTPLDQLLEISDTESAVATSLTCNEQVNHVASNEPFEVVWYKGGQNISQLRDARIWMSPLETDVQVTIGKTTHTLLRVKQYDLVIYNLRLDEDDVTYFCKVVQGSQILLAAWTVQVRQEFNSLEYFITQPVAGYITNSVSTQGSLANQVTADSVVTLLCGGVGFCQKENRLSYTWYKEGAFLAKGGRRVLSSGDIGGKYQCKVWCGIDLFTEKLTVTVPTPVDSRVEAEFEVEPPLYKGYILGSTLGNIDIPCSIKDSAQFRRTYYFNGEEIEVPITVAQASQMNSGVVQCTFVDKLTETVWVQRTTQVAIIGRPEIRKTLPEEMAVGNTLHVFELQTVSFSFTVTCPGPVHVQLLTDGQENRVCSGVERKFFNEVCTVRDNVYTITINKFTQLNERTYTLKVSHRFYKESRDGKKYTLLSYNDSTSVQLILVKECESEIAILPVLKTYPFGTAVTLVCNAHGYPIPNVKFFKDGQPLGLWASSCKRAVGRVTCDLNLTRYSDTGLYTCSGYSDIRRVRRYCNTTDYGVTFVGKPTVSSVLLQENPDPLINSTIVCTAEGNPAPTTVFWQRNNSQRIDTDTQSFGNFRTVTVLNINKASSSTEYQCCVGDRLKKYCKEVEQRDRTQKEDERKTFSIWERQDQITLGLIIGGILVAVVLVVVILICYRRRRRAKKQLANGREPVYTSSELLPKGAKAKKSANGKEKGANYAEVEFEPKSGGRRSRPRKPEQGPGDGVNYATVRVRPVSNPRYASNP